MPDRLAERMATSHINHLAERVTSSAQSIAEDLARFAARAGQGKFLGDEARTLTEAMIRLTWQASRLDGMREIAELSAAEEPAAGDVCQVHGYRPGVFDSAGLGACMDCPHSAGADCHPAAPTATTEATVEITVNPDPPHIAEQIRDLRRYGTAPRRTKES